MDFAKNSSTSRQLFEGRKGYPYPTTVSVEEPVNLWNRDKFLGKLGTSGYPVLIRRAGLQQIDNALVIPEVRIAAKRLQENLKLLVSTGKICVSTILTDFRFKKGYVDIESSINSTLAIFRRALFNYLDNYEIPNFKEFVNKLHLFALTYTKTLSVTPLTVFLNNATSYNSGLSLDFETLPHDDDNVKVAQFLSSPAFADYSRLCGQHGFYLNRNAPWNIVANPASEQFKTLAAISYDDYFEKYQLFSEEWKTLTYFFEIFAKFIYQSFEQYNRQKPFFATETKCLDKLKVARDTRVSEPNLFDLCVVYTKILLNEHGKTDTVTYKAKNVEGLLKSSYKLLEIGADD